MKWKLQGGRVYKPRCGAPYTQNSTYLLGAKSQLKCLFSLSSSLSSKVNCLGRRNILGLCLNRELYLCVSGRGGGASHDVSLLPPQAQCCSASEAPWRKENNLINTAKEQDTKAPFWRNLRLPAILFIELRFIRDWRLDRHSTTVVETVHVFVPMEYPDVRTCDAQTVKRLVHPKISIPWSITHAHVVPKPGTRTETFWIQCSAPGAEEEGRSTQTESLRTIFGTKMSEDFDVAEDVNFSRERASEIYAGEKIFRE